MNEDATSLNRLHDLVLPPDVPWWPLAPGWHALILFALVLLLAIAHRSWKNWQTNAYRRAALRELASAQDAPAIAEVLRCTALAIVPREVIADKTGTAWLDWLASQCPLPIADTVRIQLTSGVYDRPATNDDVTALRDYAARWIEHHQPVPAQMAKK